MKVQQIELFRTRKGGSRAGAGRPKGEKTKVVRIPESFLKSVTEIINGSVSSEPLKSVTEIKDDHVALLAVSALREYFRGEYLMGASDSAFICFIDNLLNSVTENKEVSNG